MIEFGIVEKLFMNGVTIKMSKIRDFHNDRSLGRGPTQFQDCYVNSTDLKRMRTSRHFSSIWEKVDAIEANPEAHQAEILELKRELQNSFPKADIAELFLEYCPNTVRILSDIMSDVK